MKKVICYTDGGCRGNPGVGGWGYMLIDPSTGSALQAAGGENETTNNRMEMTAAIEAMRCLKSAGTEIKIFTDSKYLIDCCSKWMAGWKAKGWKKKGGELKNVDLLKLLDEALVTHKVTWQWVKGHDGDPGNECVDGLANEAMDLIAAGKDPVIQRRTTWTL